VQVPTARVVLGAGALVVMVLSNEAVVVTTVMAAVVVVAVMVHLAVHVDSSLQYASPMLHHPHLERHCVASEHGSPVHVLCGAVVRCAEAVVVTVLNRASEAVVVAEAVVMLVLTRDFEVVLVMGWADVVDEVVVVVVVVITVEDRVVGTMVSPKLDESWKLVVPQIFGFVA
jgi:hypothetical protein